MTLVIATGGIDLSVGAVVAIAGARRLHRTSPARPTRAASARGAAAIGDRARRLRCVLGAVERVPGRGARHPADHRHADPDGRRPRPGPADHRRPDHHRQQRRRSSRSAPASCSACRSPILIALAVFAAGRAAHPAHRARHADRVGRRSTPRPAGWPASARAAIIWTVYVFCAAVRRHRRPDDQLERLQRPTPTTPACGSSWTRSSPWSSAARRWPAAASPSPARCSAR